MDQEDQEARELPGLHGLAFPGLCVTHSPTASVHVHVTVHLQGPAGVAVQVDGVQATGDVAVLLNLAAV